MNDRFVRACRREPVDATPVWFMRQAGRSFAAYRQLRERYGILELAKTPDLCAEVTLMPVHELGVDASKSRLNEPVPGVKSRRLPRKQGVS